MWLKKKVSMTLNKIEKEPILIAGYGKMAYSATVCLLLSGYRVTLCTDDKEDAAEKIILHNLDLKKYDGTGFDSNLLEVTDQLESCFLFKTVIVITGEDVEEKKSWISSLEKILPATSIIAVNTESIPLSKLQAACRNPERVIGVNWTEPVHTTYFLEIISNETSNKELAAYLVREAKQNWGKDPYIIYDELGIRSKMMAAMIREAFYLVENGFASIEDIDRACRNDPGYYLPFAGNFRYIDLMGGAKAYGRVMKDLNPELSTSIEVPDFFTEAARHQETLSNNTKGLYEYQDGEEEKKEQAFRKFSYQVQKIIDKFPFNFSKKIVEKRIK
jgi:3-hydroxybutyryl-CoA dehydrogenase